MSRKIRFRWILAGVLMVGTLGFLCSPYSDLPMELYGRIPRGAEIVHQWGKDRLNGDSTHAVKIRMTREQFLEFVAKFDDLRRLEKSSPDELGQMPSGGEVPANGEGKWKWDEPENAELRYWGRGPRSFTRISYHAGSAYYYCSSW